MIKYKLKVTNIKQESKDTITYNMEKPADLTWPEGSHTHLAIVGFDEGETPNKDLVRHMSISTLPSENVLGITTRLHEPSSLFKTKLSNISVGDELVVFKLGSRLTLRRENRPIVLLSMGVGIATMRPLILAYNQDGFNIPSLVSINVDASQEFLFQKEFESLNNPHIHTKWANCRSNFYEELDQLTTLDNAIYYVVGGDSFIKDNITKLRNKNVKDEDILLDKKPEIAIDYYFS